MEGRLRNMAAVYLFRKGRILLLYRQGGRVVNDVWVGSAGGHFEEKELNDARACVLRELQEELGLEAGDLEHLALRYITFRRTKGEIRQNYYFFADLRDGVGEELSSNEGVSRWFSLEELPSLEMPYSAKYVMHHYCEIGRFTDKLYMGAADYEGVSFLELPEF